MILKLLSACAVFAAFFCCAPLATRSEVAQAAESEMGEWRIEYWEWKNKNQRFTPEGEKALKELPKEAELLVTVRLYRTEKDEAIASAVVGSMVVRAAVLPDKTHVADRETTVFFSVIRAKPGASDDIIARSTTRTFANKDIKTGERTVLSVGGTQPGTLGYVTLTFSKKAVSLESLQNDYRQDLSRVTESSKQTKKSGPP